MLDTNKQICKLVDTLEKDKGITFNLISKEKAITFLKTKNNYMRTMSYKINYRKFDSGVHEGEYANLDFAYLIELSKIDMHIRKFLIQMSIDLEHYLKIHLLHLIDISEREDGYKIVEEFLDKNSYLCSNIANKRNMIFVGDLINKYFTVSQKGDLINNSCPIWAFVEILSFGDLVKLYSLFCSQNDIKPLANCSVLKSAVNIRNACAHNNCVLRDLRRHNGTKPNVFVSNYISKIEGLGKDQRKAKLSVRPLLEIVSLFACYECFVPNDERVELVSEFKEYSRCRMLKNINYFDSNDLVKSSILFLYRLIDNLDC